MAVALKPKASTANRNHRRRARTRAALLDAGNQVFREKGVDSATVTDITERADVAYGSFYNYFKNNEELVSALAERAMQRVVECVRDALRDDIADISLTAAVGVRIMLRLFSDDPATRWLIERPHAFVSEYLAVVTPFMREVEGDAARTGKMNPAGGQETWLRTFPWILLSELQDVLVHDNLAQREDTLARMTLRLHGVDDDAAQQYLATSGERVAAVDIS